MVPIAMKLRGNTNRLLHHRRGRPYFHFHRYNLCLDVLRSFNSSALANVALSHSSLQESEIVPQRDNPAAIRPNYQTFLWLLDGCLSSGSGSLSDVQRIHGLILKSGFIQKQELCSSLIAFYVADGRFCDADKVFDDLLLCGSTLPLTLWNRIIAFYATKKLSKRVLSMFSQMMYEDAFLDEITFSNVLKGCGGSGANRVSLRYIKQIHAKVVRCGFINNHIACNPLIDLYAKNGLIDYAESVFQLLSFRDSATWVAMISGLSQNGFKEQSILLFNNEMHAHGIVPTPYVLSSMLSASSKTGLFELGKELHALTFKWGLSHEVFVCNALVSLYCRLGDFNSAERIFKKIQMKDGVSYNSLISGLAQHGFSERSFKLFKEMQRDSFKPDCVTVASLLSACGTVGAIHKGLQLHSYVLKSGICSDMIIEGSLLDLYVKCSDVETAHKFFLTTKAKNVVLWNLMLVAYGQIGDIYESCRIFSQMQMEGLEPNQFTYPSILRTCTSAGASDLGEQIHGQTIKTGFQFNLYVCSVLIDMYAKLGNVISAEKIFTRLQENDVVSWTAMIAGYAQLEMHVEALQLFQLMQKRRIQPDNIVFASAISACSGIQLLQQGRQIHAQSHIYGYSTDLSIGNALVSLYARCGKVEEAYLAFRKINIKDNISWNTLISGLAQSGHYEEALKVFAQMNQACIEANLFTYGSVISAAANTANVKQGKQVHAKLIKTGYNLENQASNALITLYAKCGSIDDAKKEFSDMTTRSEVTYNAMITGYSQHGYGNEALELFKEMKMVGFVPNHFTFVSVLSACSHVGLVEEGLSFFRSMSEEYGLVPKPQHYLCVVDILGRAGFLDRARKFIDDMPIEPDAMIWRTLLSACTIHKDMDVGKLAADHLMELEPDDSATYALISNMYAVNRKWDNRDMARRLMKGRGVKKEPGRSWIEVKNSVHAFFAGDRLHSLSDKIYEQLEELNKLAAEIGYVVDNNSLTREIDKDTVLNVHSERLAIAFGLLSLPSSAPICVMKNLRVCNDCHNWIKCISRISNRAIVVRDAHRFHHFEGGMCSCKDYCNIAALGGIEGLKGQCESANLYLCDQEVYMMAQPLKGCKRNSSTLMLSSVHFRLQQTMQMLSSVHFLLCEICILSAEGEGEDPRCVWCRPRALFCSTLHKFLSSSVLGSAYQRRRHDQGRPDLQSIVDVVAKGNKGFGFSPKLCLKYLYPQFVDDGVFFAELSQALTRELAEDGYSAVEVHVSYEELILVLRCE